MLVLNGHVRGLQRVQPWVFVCLREIDQKLDEISPTFSCMQQRAPKTPTAAARCPLQGVAPETLLGALAPAACCLLPLLLGPEKEGWGGSHQPEFGGGWETRGVAAVLGPMPANSTPRLPR